MEYLFVELMLWGKAAGYQRFSLGMVPLAGLERRRLAPLWSQAGAFLFRYGEHFYNFQGLLRFKAKFAPVWEPRYLAAPGGFALPRVLGDATLLISGGVAGLVTR
jgi:phosphatidylglycerol lysyltransferase